MDITFLALLLTINLLYYNTLKVKIVCLTWVPEYGGLVPDHLAVYIVRYVVVRPHPDPSRRHAQHGREQLSMIKQLGNLQARSKVMSIFCCLNASPPPPHSDDIEKWLKLKQLTYNKKDVFNFHI